MGQRLAAILSCIVTLTMPAWTAGAATSSPETNEVLRFFEGHGSETVDAFLGGLRPAPPDLNVRARVIASLPRTGGLEPSGSELEKIAAAQRVVDYSARKGVITFQVIDLDHAFVGLHARTVVLVSR